MHYENLGEGGNALAPHLVQGFAFDRDTGDEDRYWLPEGNASNAIEVGNTPSQRSFTYHYDTVSIRFTDLQPLLLYWMKVTYLQEKGGTRIQNLDVDRFLLHDAFVLPKGTAESYTYAIPSEAYADGEIVLNFNRLAGPNAAVSEVSILEANPTTRVGRAFTKSAESNDETIGRAIRMSEQVVIDGTLDEWPCSTQCFLKVTTIPWIHLWCYTHSGMIIIFILRELLTDTLNYIRRLKNPAVTRHCIFLSIQC